MAPHLLGVVWPHVETLIESGLNSSIGDNSKEMIYRDLVAKRALLWIAATGGEILAAITSQIVVTPKTKMLVLANVGGKQMERWVKFMDDFENFAKAEGCGIVRIYGRPGWKRILRDRGFEEPWTALEKRV